MQEIELKFQIPEAALATVRAALTALPGGDRPPQVLQAAYFDTPDRKLGRARAALRVRREDDEWVQTLKAAGPNALTRLEDNRPSTRNEPTAPTWPDLALHQGDARTALMRDLGWQPDADPHGRETGLVALYSTDMRRLRAWTRVTDADGSELGVVELALDEGWIEAGPLKRRVRELEIELIEGSPTAVLTEARRWVVGHGVWLDVQTKAHRGDQLAREAETGVARPAPPSRRKARAPRAGQPAADTAQRAAALHSALEQLSMNLSEIGQRESAEDVGPWVHGAAVALRRVRRLGVAPHLMGGVTTLLTKLRSGREGEADTGVDAVAHLARGRDASLLQLDLLDAALKTGG